MGKRTNLHLFPISVFLLTSCSFLITYAISVRVNHVNAFLPYISTTGAYPPESCIFSFCVTISAFLLAICVYIRHLYVIYLCDRFTRLGRTMINFATTCGFIACLGLAMVGSFQVSNVPTVHYTGALMCFIGAFVYFSFQGFFSYRLKRKLVYLYLLYLRWALCILCMIQLVLFIVGNVLSTKESRGSDWVHWSGEQSGYDWHIVSALCEWFMFYSLDFLILTFLPEFKTVAVRAPRIYIEGVSKPRGTTNGVNLAPPSDGLTM